MGVSQDERLEHPAWYLLLPPPKMFPLYVAHLPAWYQNKQKTYLRKKDRSQHALCVLLAEKNFINRHNHEHRYQNQKQ
jgi:hypothetical protein